MWWHTGHLPCLLSAAQRSQVTRSAKMHTLCSFQKHHVSTHVRACLVPCLVNIGVCVPTMQVYPHSHKLVHRRTGLLFLLLSSRNTCMCKLQVAVTVRALLDGGELAMMDGLQRQWRKPEGQAVCIGLHWWRGVHCKAASRSGTSAAKSYRSW